MGHIVALDDEGHLVYEGLLSSKEIATIDEILNALKQEIPQIESDLEETYGKSVLYKYNLGKFLGSLLTKYNISASERRKFCASGRISSTALATEKMCAFLSGFAIKGRRSVKMTGENLKKDCICI